jgi:hypothetical protein
LNHTFELFEDWPLTIYQTDSMVDASTAAARAVEGDIIDVIEVDVGF